MSRLHTVRLSAVLCTLLVLGAVGLALSQHRASATDDPWVTSTARLTVGGLARSYVLVRPAERSRGILPVVILLHGRNMTAVGMVDMTGFERVAPSAVLVYPSGYRASWNAGTCCGPAQVAHVDDVAFLEAVVSRVLATVPDTSPHRVFLAGYSNGGRMVYRMACSTPGLFSGFAAVEAVSVFHCAAPRPVRLLEVASTGDPLLTIHDGSPPKRINGVPQLTVDDLVAAWRRVDGCGPPAAPAQYGSMRVSTWRSCPVQAALLPGGSHRWPAEASRLIWRFAAADFGGPATGAAGR